jgi:endonuclease-3
LLRSEVLADQNKVRGYLEMIHTAAEDSAKIVARLREFYGAPRAAVTDPFEMILLENVAYLVDDATRRETFEKLREEIGFDKLLTTPVEEIARVIEGGGMKPPMRAEKVIECARLREEFGTPLDRKVLRKYPGVGEPLADKILLFNGKLRTLAPESNALRVLLRLGYGVESKNYAASYKSAVAAAGELPDAMEAHLLLRKHGQELCKRSAPRCELCPLRGNCDFYSNLMARSRVHTRER